MVFFSFHMQYSLTAVDRVVQRSLPKMFVNLYRDTAYLELTNAYGLFRKSYFKLSETFVSLLIVILVSLRSITRHTSRYLVSIK